MASETIALADLDAADRKAVGAVAGDVKSMAAKYGIVKESGKTLAPRIMRLFNTLAAKYESLGGFIGFARLFDPSIPLHAGPKDNEPGYRNHKMYYTLDYLRRTYTTANRPRGSQGRRDPARDSLARLIATILQTVSTPETVYEAVKREFSMADRGIAQLKARVAESKPLLNLKGITRAVAVDTSKIVHVDPAAKPSTSEPVNVEATVRRVMGKRKPGRPSNAERAARAA